MRINVEIRLSDFQDVVRHLFDETPADIETKVRACVQEATGCQLVGLGKENGVVKLSSNSFQANDVYKLGQALGRLADQFNERIFQEWQDLGHISHNKVLGTILEDIGSNTGVTVGIDFDVGV